MNKEYDDLVLEKLNYNSYLKIPELLSLQQRRTDPPHHDEMFFIIIHQAAELWFKETLHETGKLMEAFDEGIVSRALKLLRRIRGIMEVQVRQINLLSTLTPVEFAGFREMLKPASGFQSMQFRLFEFTYGLRDPFFLKFFKNMPEVATKLEKVAALPSVYDKCLTCMKRDGYAVPEALLSRDYSQPWELNDGLVDVIASIYANPEEKYHWVLLFETMLDLDEKIAMWRHTHNLMVHRTIGSKKGTGGSEGYEFLRKREPLRCFPELWEVRNYLGG